MGRIKRSKQSGFTIYELIIVIVILLMMALLTAPTILNALTQIRLSAAAQKLAMDIRHVRELALSNHDIYGIEFNQANNNYTLFHWDGSAKTTLTDTYKGGQQYIIDFDDLPEYGGVTINSLNVCEGFGCPTSEIRIDAFGRPYDSGSTAFTSPATIVLQNGSDTRTITVTDETAFTRVS
jgi:prepilin-type N-terminal cleavage/methylation domain-containing protein